MDIKEVIPPTTLSKEQVKFAQQFVKMRFVDGLSIADACKTLSSSTATFYRWKEQPAFESYLKALESSMVADDEREAYRNVKAYILRKVNEANPSDKHIEMFMKHFEYVIEAENSRRMAELGITKTASGKQDFRTLDERKSILLSRLKG